MAADSHSVPLRVVGPGPRTEGETEDGTAGAGSGASGALGDWTEGTGPGAPRDWTVGPGCWAGGTGGTGVLDDWTTGTELGAQGAPGRWTPGTRGPSRGSAHLGAPRGRALSAPQGLPGRCA